MLTLLVAAAPAQAPYWVRVIGVGHGDSITLLVGGKRVPPGLTASRFVRRASIATNEMSVSSAPPVVDWL